MSGVNNEQIIARQLRYDVMQFQYKIRHLEEMKTTLQEDLTLQKQDYEDRLAQKNQEQIDQQRELDMVWQMKEQLEEQLKQLEEQLKQLRNQNGSE